MLLWFTAFPLLSLALTFFLYESKIRKIHHVIKYKKQNISLRFPLMSAKSATAVDELAGSRASDETSSVCHSVLMAANMSSPLFLSCRRVTTLDRNRPDASCNQKKRGTIVTKTTPVDFKIKKIKKITKKTKQHSQDTKLTI